MQFILACVFLFLLPFHAFLVTWFSSVFLGSGNDFLPQASMILASWKEIFIVFFGFAFLWKWIKEKKFPITFYTFDYFFFAFLGIAILSGIFITKDLGQIIWGLKYDFSFFVLFYLIRGLAFPSEQKQKLLTVFFGSAFLSIVFGIIFYFVLPPEALTHFGYSSHVSSFDLGKPLPAYHIIDGSETPRLASTFSSPNHFGFYLIVVISFLLALIKLKVESRVHGIKLKVLDFTRLVNPRFILLFIVFATANSLLIVLFFTFSRASWLAVLAVLGIFVFVIIPQKWRKILLFEGVGTLVIACALLFIFAPQNLFRQGSNSEHFTHTRDAIFSVIKHPLGLGLGNAGPASMRDESFPVRVPKQELQKISDAGLSDQALKSIWFFDKGITEEMAFKPKNRDELNTIPELQKTSPALQSVVMDIWNRYHVERIAENWHVQMFQEFGWAGGFVWLLFLSFFLFTLFKKSSTNVFAFGGFLALTGISIAGLFLHSFEDASVSLSLFFLLGLVDCN